MIVNAILGAAILVLVAFALARVLSGRWALTAILAACLVNVAPFAFDNILLGFNTHFYLLPAFSLIALWLVRRQPGVVGAMGGWRARRRGLVLLHGLRRADARSGRGDAWRSRWPAAAGTGLREGLGIAALAGGDRRSCLPSSPTFPIPTPFAPGRPASSRGLWDAGAMAGRKRFRLAPAPALGSLLLQGVADRPELEGPALVQYRGRSPGSACRSPRSRSDARRPSRKADISIRWFSR